MAGNTGLATLLLVCGLVTAGTGLYIVRTSASIDERWPNAGPTIVDKSGTLDVEIAERTWLSADELWRSKRIALSFIIIPKELSEATPGGTSSSLPDEPNAPPLRMSASVTMGEVPRVSFAATPSLERVLGATCLEDAVRPLAERAATIGSWDHAAGTIIAYLTGAFGILPLSEPLDRAEKLWLPLGCALTLTALGVFSSGYARRRARSTTTESAPNGRTNTSKEEAFLSKLRAAFQAADAEVIAAEERAKTIDVEILGQRQVANKITWTQRVPVVGWAMRARLHRHLARLQTELRDQQAALAAAIAHRSTAETAIERGRTAVEQRQLVEVERVQRRIRRIAALRRAIATAIAVVAVVATTLAGYDAMSADDDKAGGRILLQRPIEIPSDSALYAALETNRDLIERFRNECNMTMAAVTLPQTPQAVPTPPIYGVTPPGPALAADPSGPHCVTGKRCGDGCIPQYRACHVEDSGQIAGPSHDSSGTYVVRGYVRTDGTYVSPHLSHYPGRHP